MHIHGMNFIFVAFCFPLYTYVLSSVFTAINETKNPLRVAYNDLSVLYIPVPANALFLLLLSTLALSYGNTLQGTIDVKRLQNILQESTKSKDVSTLYHAIKGLTILNADIPDVCQDIAKIKYDINNIEQVFHLTNVAALTGCQNFLNPEILRGPSIVLEKSDATIPELYYAVYSLKALGKGSIYDREDALKNIIQILKKDDSPANYGYVFALCEHMGCGLWTSTHAEGALLAADETDSRMLHFEGGLPVTSLVLTTILRTYAHLKKPSPLTPAQRLKFASYLVSRRGVTTAKGAAALLDAAVLLVKEQPTPMSISIKGKKYITSDSETIEISITDLIGQPIPNLKPEEVVAQSGTRLADDVVVLSKQPLTLKAGETSTFILNLSKIKAQYGLYKIALSAGSSTASVNVAVLGEIQVGNVEIGVGDVDGTTSPKVTTVAYPNKITEKLQADHLQKVSLKLSVRDAYNKPVLVQQAFVRVSDEHGETIFVAEPDSSKAYKVELNVGAIAKHLKGVSGAYSLTIYLGDSAVSNPVAWELGQVTFSFGQANAVGEAVSRGKARGPLPEISHLFREPEARPPRFLSDVFAFACAAPLLLLLALWVKLGINFKGLPLTPSVPIFHLALGGCLSLYGVLWLQLSMFETVRYLLPLAALTFLAGHRLLRRLANDNKHK